MNDLSLNHHMTNLNCHLAPFISYQVINRIFTWYEFEKINDDLCASSGEWFVLTYYAVIIL